MAAPGPMPRRRPLHTCAASVLAIIHTAYRKTQELNGPIGTLTKGITRFLSAASPLVNAMQYKCLAILSFTDDRILTLERSIETIFPPSTRLFDKIDKLVYSAEVMPEKLEKSFNTLTFLNILHQVPLLDWVVMHLIWWLNFLISSLTHWGSKNTREKDIMIDANSKNGSSAVAETTDKENCPREESESHVVPPNFAESENKEKLIPEVVDSSKDEENETTAKGELTSAPLMGSSFQEECKAVGHIELPNIAQLINKEKLLPVLASFQGESKLICRVEFPSTAEPEHKNEGDLHPSHQSDHVLISSPAGDAFEDKSNSVGHVESPSCAGYENKEELVLPVSDQTTKDTNAQSENETSLSAMGNSLQDEIKAVGVELFEPDIVESSDKEMFEKGTKENTQVKADIALEKPAEIRASEEKIGLEREEEIKKKKEVNPQDPILELFEARWHM